jgi:cation transport ATPase
MKNVRVSTPEMFAKFAKFANFTVIATLTRGTLLLLGVIGHEGSTVIVVLNGLRLLRTRDGMAATRHASQ